MRLSVLVLSIRPRQTLLTRLLERLSPQLKGGVELLIHFGSESVGVKRNQLLDAATGDYIAFVDDDDLVSPDYVAQILDALESNPDCVGFKVRRFGFEGGTTEATHSIRFTKYGSRMEGAKEIWQRPPNHLNPVRSELARQVKFPDTNDSEDFDYAMRLRPLLQTEAFVDRHLYDYLYVAPACRLENQSVEITE